MHARNAVDLLAIDPSISSSGVALFKRGVLMSAKTITRSIEAADIGSRALAMALDIRAWISAVGIDPRVLVFEWPQIYTAAKSKGNPNDLIALAAIGAGVGGMLYASAAVRNVAIEVLTPTPAEWIGQLPKSRTGNAWDSPRGQRIGKRLDERERARIGAKAQHDALDAVGLGLWSLGRLDRERVFPGAT
jgi:hypothetical protein